MKTRIGFVSNSSSSSFIVRGWKIDQFNFVKITNNGYDWKNTDKFFDENKIDYTYDYSLNAYFVGNIIALGDYGLVELDSNSLEVLLDDEPLNKLREKYPGLEKPKLYGGIISD
jgi:hypothetical protein